MYPKLKQLLKKCSKHTKKLKFASSTFPSQNMQAINDHHSQVAVVMVPLPAQGHLNQLLHLCRHVSAHNIPVYYIASTIHIHQVKNRVHGWNPLSIANLHFQEFPTPPFANLQPDHSNSSNKFPSHTKPMSRAILSHLLDPLSLLVKELSKKFKRVVVIFDSLLASTVKPMQNQLLPNVEFYIFRSISVFTLYSYYWENLGKLDTLADQDGILEQIPSNEGCFSVESQEFVKSQQRAADFHTGTIYNTSRITEGVYIDLMAKLVARSYGQDQKHFALGPFNPLSVNSESRPGYLEWLDKQQTNSVVFVSFGTSTSLPDEQVKELAFGLENSQQKFIWVLRDADKGDIFTGEDRKLELPEGFEERVQESGIIVRDWAPQLEILGHSSVGGFMSHCGWNSCMESISMGVPIVAWPMHSDQPRNAVLLTKVLKIGLQVMDWEKRHEIVSSFTVKEAVRRLMFSKEGDEMRQRAEKLAVSFKESMMEGGAARMEMDSFIAHICR